jgi:hypothetical protein
VLCVSEITVSIPNLTQINIRATGLIMLSKSHIRYFWDATELYWNHLRSDAMTCNVHAEANIPVNTTR